MSGLDLSLAIPAYNEAPRIVPTLERVAQQLDPLGLRYEILLGDDGSRDGTALAATRAGVEGLRVLSGPHRGKGATLTRCFRHARGETLAFLDADLEIDAVYLPPLLELVEDGADAAIASKVLHRESFRARPWRRRVSTRLYNAAVRALFGTPFHDHQAGLKVFRASALRPLLGSIASEGWLWDTEVLVRLHREGHTIREVAVPTRPPPRPRDAPLLEWHRVIAELLGLYWRLRRRP